MRMLITALAVAVVAIGVAALGWVGRSGSPGLAARLQQEKDALEQELALAGSRLKRQDQELEATRLEIERLTSQLADAEHQAARAAALAETVERVDAAVSEPEEPPQATMADEPLQDRRDWWERRRGGDDGEELTPEEQEARRAEWAARRQEFANRMRENVSNFYSSQLEKAGDSASQQRILAMEDYSNYMMDLFQQMRATEDEEERDRLREEMDSARDTMRSLVDEQQDQMLRQLASEIGVNSGTRQDEFVSRMRETIEDPFFRAEGMLGGVGGGRGRWGGGFEGFGGGRGEGGPDSSPAGPTPR